MTRSRRRSQSGRTATDLAGNPMFQPRPAVYRDDGQANRAIRRAMGRFNRRGGRGG